MNTAPVYILTINGGSSSIKFAIYELSEDLKRKISGSIERIGMGDSVWTVVDDEQKTRSRDNVEAPDFHGAALLLRDWLEDQPDLGRIKCIGHRIVHGGSHTKPEKVNQALLNDLHRIAAYDPDHLPAEIELIHLFSAHYPDIMQVACFDTSFHLTLPRVAKLFALPRRFEKEGIQRYGFHGLSYAYLMETLYQQAGEQDANGRVILAHLGSGASLAAIREGKCIETSMGFSPAGGIMMGTRCGDLDPGVAWYMMQSERMTPEQFNHLVNHEAGLLGVSEISADIKDLLERESSDMRAKEAVDLFCYTIKKWIGAYTAVLGGLDTLVFSGGIGENAASIRSRICEGLQYAGVHLDRRQNEKNATLISTPDSRVNVRVIRTDEQVMIARYTASIYKASEHI